MDKKLSWTRIAISVAIDWRLLVVIVVLEQFVFPGIIPHIPGAR